MARKKVEKVSANDKEAFIARKLRAINGKDDVKAQARAERIIRRNQGA